MTCEDLAYIQEGKGGGMGVSICAAEKQNTHLKDLWNKATGNQTSYWDYFHCVYGRV